MSLLTSPCEEQEPGPSLEQGGSEGAPQPPALGQDELEVQLHHGSPAPSKQPYHLDRPLDGPEGPAPDSWCV
jgi:hypothetical protein